MTESSDDLLARLEGEPEPRDQSAMVIRQTRIATVTVGELKERIAKRPDHPVARVYKGAIADKEDAHTVRIENVDLIALIRNLSVVSVKRTERGETIITKRLGDSLDKKQPAPTPDPKPAK